MTTATLSALLASLISPPPAQAAPAYQPTGPCGTAKVVSGDTCSNVKVQFNFDGCKTKSEPQMAGKVSCEGHNITARFAHGDYRYEAKFQKAEDGWGGVEWKPLAAMTEFEKKPEAPKTAKKPASPPAPTAAAPTPAPGEREPSSYPVVNPTTAPAQSLAPAPAAAAGLKFSAYVDARLSTRKVNDKDGINTPAIDPNAESGYGLEDGAVYVSYEKDNLSFLIDMPFRRFKSADDAGMAGGANVSNTSKIAVGVDKAQLWGKYKFNDTVAATLGQFDTIFGLELNDSKDRVFNKTGLVYDVTLPVTHTGLMLEASSNGFTGKLFSANSNNKGSLGDDGAGKNVYEYGVTAGYVNETYRGQIGYLTRPTVKLDGSNGARTLTDILLGATFGAFTIDAEYNIVSDPAKNTLTADPADTEKNGTGLEVLATYKLNDAWLLGARFESLQNDPGNGFKESGSSGVAVHYRVAPELETRAEYSTMTYKTAGDLKWDQSYFNVGALFFF